MTSREKRLERISRNPRNVSSREMMSLLEAYGFVRTGGKGSHTCYVHRELPGVRLTIPRTLKVAYVKQALQAVYRVREVEENGCEDD